MNKLIPGTVVSTMIGPIEHFGIVSDRFDGGIPRIISNSKKTGCVSEEPAKIFTNGKKVRVHTFRGNLSSYTVIARARSLIGSNYNLLNWNCEHFIRWGHGLKPESPQIKSALFISVAVLAICFTRK